MITNNKNHPQNIVRAIAPDRPYTPNPGRIGVTGLIDAPLPRTLKLRHYDEIVEDVDDMLYMFYGNLADEVVKQAAGPWDLVSVKIEIPTTSGLVLVGKPDIISLKEKLIRDIKFTGAYSVIYKSSIEKWTQQLNVYDWMVRLEMGSLIQVEGLEIQALLRDFTKYKAMADEDYPNSGINIIPIPRWSDGEQRDYIESRLKDHEDNPERECTPAEKWQESITYAVIKGNNKRATRVLDTEAKAIEYIKEKEVVGARVVKRKGKNKKCQDFCRVNKFCPYFKE